MVELNKIIAFWQAAGWVVPVLILLSITSWYWMFSVYFRLKKACLRSDQFEEEISLRLADQDDENNIRTWLAGKEGIIPRITAYVLNARGTGRHTLRDRFLEARMAELLPLRRELNIISNLVKVAPLLGLLGTVIGMVETFAALGISGAGSSIVASGISKSLLTTQMGMLIALPGIFIWQYLDSLFKRLSEIITALEFQLINVLAAEENA